MTSAASSAVESGWSLVADVAVFLHKIRMGHIDILDVFLALWIITSVFTHLGFTLYDRLKERRRTDSLKLNQTRQVVIEAPITSASTSQQYHQHVVTDHGGHWANNVASSQGVRGGSTSDWVNSVVQWIYSQQSQYTPQQVTTSWLKALNDEAKRQGSSVQVTFEAMVLGPTPPRFSNITVESEPKNVMTVTCDLEAEGIDFGVFASQQTASTVKLTNCNATVQKLSGKVQCIIRTFGEDWHITATLEEDTVLHLKITPQITQNENVDIHAMEEIIRNAILSATFTTVIPTRALPRDMPGLAWSRHKPATTHSTLPRTTTANHVPTKPHTAQEPRLLVKVIKANNLQRHTAELDGDPYCVVTLDNPIQRHRTKFIKGSTNPFWDEQFLFQIGQQSREITFEIHDKGNNDRFQGGTTLPLATIDRSRGSRHIIQLQSRPGHNDNVSGSIVLFLLFMQTPDTLKKPASPSRKIERKQMQTPDGTIITTVTTKTSRPKHLGAGNNNEIPTKVYTHSVNGALTPGTPSDTDGYWTPTCATAEGFIVPDEVSPVMSVSTKRMPSITFADPGPDSKSAVADTAIRHFQEQAHAQQTPTKKSTLIIHGVSEEPYYPDEEPYYPDESPTDDYSNLQDAPEPISRNDTSRASRRRFLFFGRRKSKDGGKGGSRSSSFDESSLSSKSPEPQLRRAKTIDIPDSDEVSSSAASEQTPKKKKKRFLGFMRRKKPKDRKYHSSIDLKAEPDEGTVSDTPREKTGNTLKVPASNQYTRSASTGDIKYERYLTVESFRQAAVVGPSGPSGSQTSVDRLSYTESNV